MSEDHLISGVESPKEHLKTTIPIDFNDIEIVFGTSDAPKDNTQPDVHLLTNEREHGMDTVPAILKLLYDTDMVEKNEKGDDQKQKGDLDLEYDDRPLLQPIEEPPLPKTGDEDDDTI